MGKGIEDGGLSIIGSNNNGGYGRSILGIVGGHNNNNSNSNGDRLDILTENPRIKEISRAYKVNLDPINDLKDRYR